MPPRITQITGMRSSAGFRASHPCDPCNPWFNPSGLWIVGLAALAALAAPLRAADLETPSVFRPTVRENIFFSDGSNVPATEPMSLAAAVSVRLPGGETLSAWLEGAPIAALRVQRGTAPAETMDAAAWAGVSPALAVYPDGTVLLAYRSRTKSGTTEVMLARLVEGTWQKPQVLTTDSWKPAGDISRAGPRLAHAGSRAVVTWFTASGDEPRVLATTSSDAGESFTQAVRIDVGFSTGGADVLMLHDGTQLVSWIERRGEDDSQPGGLYLRRTTAYGTTMAPALIVPAAQLASGTHPRLGLVKDYTDTAAQLSVTFNPAGQPNTNKTLLITLPEADVLLAADQGCGCTPSLAAQSGVTIRARIMSVSADKKTIRLRHNAVPGLFAAGDRDYSAGPDLPADIRSGLEVLAHLDDKDGAWLLLDYRVLVMAPSSGRGK